jgi:hypothetical protein
MAGVNAAAVWEISKQYSEIRKGDRQDQINIAEMETKIQHLRLASSQAGLTEVQTLDLINQASAKEDELIQYKIRDKQEELDIVKQLIPFMEDNKTLLDEEARLTAEIIGLEAEKSLRIAREKAALQEKITNQKEKELEAQNKLNDTIAESTYEARLKMSEETAKDFYSNLDTWVKDSLDTEKDYTKVVMDQIGDMVDSEIADFVKAWRLETEAQKQAQEDKKAALAATAQVAESVYSAMASSYQNAMNREIKAAGDNEIKKESIRRKYFEKEKKLALTMAVIKGAVAVVNAWQEGSLYENIAETIAIAAITAAEITAIEGQQYAKGGSGILGGRPHISGGVPIPGFGTAEAGEHLSITSRAMTSKYGGETLDAISNSINQGKFFEVWGNTARSFSDDPYTRKMYELMMKTPVIYPDSYGNTVKQYPDGKTVIIKKVWLN